MNRSPLRSILPPLTITLASLALAGCGGGALRASIATADKCPTGEDCTHAGFDAPVAIGATVHPDFQTQLSGSSGQSFHYVAVAPTVLAVDDGAVTGRAAGTSALLLVTDGETVVDFLHVWVKQPTKVRLAATVPGRDKSAITDGPVELLVGDSIFVSAVLSADGQRLIGTAPSEWKADEGVLSILREGSVDRRRVVALKPGKTELSVSVLGLDAKIEVIVRRNDVASSRGVM